MLHTARLDIRHPVEADRQRFVELFADPDFMAFAAGPLAADAASSRFDEMVRTAAQVPFAKQPIVERSSGKILGYAGVAYFELDGDRHLEFGYRLCIEGRGKGYATEAGQALIDLARSTFTGTIYGMIDPTNEPSMRVIAKLGFDFWCERTMYGESTNMYRRLLP